MLDSFTIGDARNLAQRWRWEQLTAAQRMQENTEAYDRDPTLRRPRHRPLYGLFTYGPAYPGALDPEQRGQLLAWVREFGPDGLKVETRLLPLLLSEARGHASDLPPPSCSGGGRTTCEREFSFKWG